MITLAMRLITLALGGLGIGFVSAIAGIGGGSLMVPFMVILMGYDVKVAIATSLACIIATSTSSASVYLRSGMVNVKTALTLEPLTAIGAVIGAYATVTLPHQAVRVALGGLLFATAIGTYLKGVYTERRGMAVQGVRGFKEASPGRKITALLSSAFAGLVSGMFGIGGGVLKVPIMNIALDMPIKTAVATSLFMIGITASSGTLVYLSKGLPDALSVAALVSGLIPGATLGARYLKRLKSRWVRLAFVILLAYAGMKLMIPSL